MSKSHKALCLFCLSLFLIWALIPAQAESSGTGLHIYFLDVGQGDAAVILCDGEAMIIDGGESKHSSFIYSFLWNTLELEEVKIMIASHPHADHVGGLAAALNACPVGVLYTPVTEYETKTWQSVIKYAEAQGTPILIPEPGEQLALGGATVDILGPIWYSNNMNDLSLIVKITYGSTSFLFTGDAEWDEEHDLIEAGIDLSADVLKVAHHGSDTSTSYVFLREVAPTYAVISVSKESQYGHPHSETLNRLEDAGVIVYRTDIQGTIECISDGETISFLQ